MAKILYLIREPRFVQRDEPLLQVAKPRIMFYLAWQFFGIIATIGVSQTIAGIGFPVLIIALIPLRVVVLPKFFTAKELRTLDAPTANNAVVLASLGGLPRMREGKDEEETLGGNSSGSGSGEGVATGSGGGYDEKATLDKESGMGGPNEGMRERK